MSGHIHAIAHAEPSDEELIVLVSRGNHEAFRHIMQRSSQRLSTLVTRCSVHMSGPG